MPSVPSGAVAVQWMPVAWCGLSGQVVQGPPRWSQYPSRRRPPRYSATPSSAVYLETASPGRLDRVSSLPTSPIPTTTNHLRLSSSYPNILPYLYPGPNSLRLLPPQFIFLVLRTVRSLHTPISLIRKRRHSGVHINRKLWILFQLRPETVRISLG